MEMAESEGAILDIEVKIAGNEFQNNTESKISRKG